MKGIKSNRILTPDGVKSGYVYFADGKIQDAAEHGPDYLRKSQAEREREEREAAK